MVNYIDIILLAVMALTVYISAKSGFFKTLFDLVVYVLAVTLARSFSVTLAQTAFDSFIRKGAVSYLESSLQGIGSTDYVTQAQQAVEAIPEGLRGLMQILGYSDEVLISQISSADLGGSNLIETLMNTVVEPVGTALMQFILFVILAIVLLIVGRVLVFLLNKIIRKLPVIKRLNTLLGGVIGLLKGGVIVVIAVSLISVIASASDNVGFIDAVNGSALVSSLKNVIADFNF